MEVETSQVENEARITADKVYEPAVEMLEVKDDSETLADSTTELQETDVLTPKKIKKSNKVKLAVNFRGFDPKKAAEAIAKNNKIRKVKIEEYSM